MDNKQLIKDFYENIFSHGDDERFGEYVAEDCVNRNGEKIIPVGIEGMRQHMIDVRKTYPDLQISVVRQHTDGDYVISEIIAEGTHKGEWLGMKPTGKKLTFTGVDIDKVVNGKITEHGGAVNTFETLFEEQIIQPAP
jgi:predicted ester cyclase